MQRVLVVGAAGKMGRAVVKGIHEFSLLELVGVCDVVSVGEDAGNLAGIGPIGVLIEGTLSTAIERSNPDVVVDFTHPKVVMDNIRTTLAHARHAVVGTTGLAEEDLKEIRRLAADADRNVIICPNFAIGAVLMMHTASIAARFFPDVEIIELHHDQKADAPSGTAMKTAEAIAESRSTPEKRREGEARVVCARGGEHQGIRIHSIRLPGFVAHQEVIFGAPGQTLTIRHDTTERSSFVPGVLIAIQQVGEFPGVTHGLEKLLKLY